MEPSKIIGSDSSGSRATSSVALSNHSTSGIDRRSKGLVVLLHGPKPALPLYHPSLSEHLLHAFVQLEVGVHLRGVAPCSTYPRNLLTLRPTSSSDIFLSVSPALLESTTMPLPITSISKSSPALVEDAVKVQRPHPSPILPSPSS